MRFPVEFDSAEVIERVRRSLVVIGQAGGFGAGVAWAPGLLITNDHVAHGTRATIEDGQGRSSTARVLARDPEADLALLEASVNLPPIEVADWRGLRVGQLLFALGHPLGQRDFASFGILSGLGDPPWMGRDRKRLLQADLALAPGNSGGPLFDAQGRIVGIASMIASPGVALAVPSQVVARFVAGASDRERKVA